MKIIRPQAYKRLKKNIYMQRISRRVQTYHVQKYKVFFWLQKSNFLLCLKQFQVIGGIGQMREIL